MRALVRLGLLAAAGLLGSGCLGANQLGGSADGLFPLQVSFVDVRRNEEALQITYLASRGADLDLVARVMVSLVDVEVRNGVRIPLQGEYAPGHQRTTVIHAAAGEPIRVFAPVNRGDMVIEQGGNSFEYTRGHFSMSFVTGDGYGAGRSLEGNFSAVAADAGFGP